MIIKSGQSVLCLFILFLISVMLVSCGENAPEGDGAGITFQLKWPLAKSVGSTPIPAEVVKIRMSVSGPGITTTMSKEFEVSPTSPRTGSIEGVPVGSNRIITFQGLDADLVTIYQASLPPVNLEAGKTYDCGQVSMAVLGTAVPAIPASLIATATAYDKIALVWSSASDATGYKIESNTGAGGTYVQVGVVTNATVTSWSDTSLSASTPYSYRVRAVNGIGYSGYSTEESATTLEKTYSISGTITSGGTALAGVTVTLSGGTSTATTNSTGNYTFNGVPAGSYTLTPGITGYGFSPITLPAVVTIADLTGKDFVATANTVPAAPSGLNATPRSSSRIDLAWVDNANNEDGYKVERRTGSGSFAQIGSVVKGTSYTDTDTSLAPSTTYYYRVRATNSIGDSGYSAEVNAATYDASTIITPLLVKVTGGTFTMGDIFGDGLKLDGINNTALPIHEVTVSDFYIGVYEVTQGEWETVMGYNPSSFKACGPDCPVENVSWDDIAGTAGFIAKLNLLNEQSGKSIRYRLPTEAEWEYAAAVNINGAKEKFSGSSDVSLVGWYSGNASGTTHSFGGQQANSRGIYDMSGNVSEWVNDRYGRYGLTAQTNNRVIRGGNWYVAADYNRTTLRNSSSPTYLSRYVGFRLAASAP